MRARAFIKSHPAEGAVAETGSHDRLARRILMSPKTAALLADPHPCCHIVLPYTEEKSIVAAVSFFAAEGLKRGEAVLLVTTPLHSMAIEENLQAARFNLDQLKRHERLIILDAGFLLDRILVDGMPEPSRFHKAVSKIVVSSRCNSPSGNIRLFGEMVSLLYRHNLQAAIRLEELWNGVIDRYSVPLLCTYELNGSPEHRREAFPKPLQAAHTHMLSA
jgi:hypothetical protein